MGETPSPNTLIMWRLETLERESKELRDHLQNVEARNERRDQERADLERKQLLWGIMFLGSVIMSLGGVIWSYRAVIFRGVN